MSGEPIGGGATRAPDLRERWHRARLAHIQCVQVVGGRGDRARVDHEATLLERARMVADEVAAHAATESGLEALSSLLRRVEENRCARAQDIRVFIGAVWHGRPLPLEVLRTADASAAQEMLAVLDAWRHARCVLVEQVEGGPPRIARAMSSP